MRHAIAAPSASTRCQTLAIREASGFALRKVTQAFIGAWFGL